MTMTNAWSDNFPFSSSLYLFVSDSLILFLALPSRSFSLSLTFSPPLLSYKPDLQRELSVHVKDVLKSYRMFNMAWILKQGSAIF